MASETDELSSKTAGHSTPKKRRGVLELDVMWKANGE